MYRQINRVYAPDYTKLMDSGLYARLVEARLLIPHVETQAAAVEPAIAYKIIQPERVAFISYPYEWSFSQLKDAALATLSIQKRALKSGLILKDASAYNIQFVRGEAVLIDTLSFTEYQEGKPWEAYRQFCQHFLAPLALMSYRDVRLGQLLRVYIDGVPLDLASRLLPASTKLNFGLLTHIHIHASAQRRFSSGPARVIGAQMSKQAMLGLIENLENTIKKLTWKPATLLFSIRRRWYARGPQKSSRASFGTWVETPGSSAVNARLRRARSFPSISTRLRSNRITVR